jgi:hypothetical protein
VAAAQLPLGAADAILLVQPALQLLPQSLLQQQGQGLPGLQGRC